jgi:beta-lactamase regulating signal transducer with metallopeptidase domain
MTFDFLEMSFNWIPVVDAAAKATVLLAAAALVAALMRKSSAASRHLVWTCALMAALALPVLSIALPRWQVPLVTVPGPECGPARQSPEACAASPGAGRQPGTELTSSPQSAAPGPEFAALSPQSAFSNQQSSFINLRFALFNLQSVSSNLQSAFFNLQFPGLLTLLWILGALLILGRLALGIAAVHWMSRRTQVVSDAPWLPLARRLAGQLGLSRVTFRRSEGPVMPMAWGVLRASVVMPAEADDWPEDRLRIVLLHELAHVRRADCLTHMLAQVACALYWMNPLTWIAARRIRAERERACDDLVLSCGTAGPDYADQLLEIARTMRTGRLSATMAGACLAMARHTQLEGRLMSILDPSVPRTGVSRLRTAAATMVALLALVPLASLQTWAYAAPAVLPPIPAHQTSGGAAQPPSTEVVGQRGYRLQKKSVTQEAVRSTVQNATEGALQGVSQGILEGMVQVMLESVPDAISGALGDALDQEPKPNPDPDPARRAEKPAPKADPKVVAALTEALKDSDKEVRESAMQALVRMRDPGIFEPLVQALKDASPDVRESAAFGLGQLRDKRAVAPLSGALKDASAEVREQVVFALGQIRDPATVDALAAALRDSSASVREQAAFALGQVRDERAIEPLVSVLKDSAADVREQAAFALGRLRARAAVDALMAMVADADADVREQAVFALGQIRDPRAIDALTTALKDASADVRQQAAFALGQLSR